MERIFTLSDGRLVKVSAKNRRTSTIWSDTHYAYTITVTCGNDSYKTTFHDSPMNYNHGVKVTMGMLDDALYCLLSDYDAYDSNPTYRDFAISFGYEDEKEGMKAYKTCKAAYDGLSAMFSRSDLSELNSMVNV